ncbi:MAG: DUF3137 domain-containing protein [Rhodospirillales bacterium]|nr:DUF3137 domain-containing protein [Rhodospirillales bacterium]
MLDKTQAWQNAVDLAAAMAPELELLEKKRKGHWLFLLVMIPLTWLVSLPFLYVYVFARTGSLLISVTCCLTGAAVIAVFGYRAFDRDYRRKAKRVFVYKIADLLKMRYKPYGLFPVGQVYDHYIFPSYSRSTTEDGFTFKLEDRKVELQEIQLFRHDKEGGSSFSAVLPMQERGIMIRIETRQKQPFHTLVIPHHYEHHPDFFRGMRYHQRTPFGNPAFSDRYLVLAQEHTDAHDIFNPAFIETFLAFEKELGASTMCMSVKQGEVVFYARHARDMFEPGTMLRPANTETLRQIFEELGALTALIKILKLNPYVGL